MGCLAYDGIQDEDKNGVSFRTVYVSSVKNEYIFFLSKLNNLLSHEINYVAGCFWALAGSLIYSIMCAFRMAYLSHPA